MWSGFSGSFFSSLSLALKLSLKSHQMIFFLLKMMKFSIKQRHFTSIFILNKKMAWLESEIKKAKEPENSSLWGCSIEHEKHDYGQVIISLLVYKIVMHLVVCCHIKGQLISKCLFGVFNSPIKWSKKIQLEVITIIVKLNFFRSFFGGIEDTKKTFRN